jgi:hypothetical protein
MRKLLVVATAVSAILVLASVDLGACGDKYSRVGRSSRLKGYKSLYPTSVLVYQPAGAKEKDVKDYRKGLIASGHKPTFLKNGGDVARAVAEGKYELLIVHYPDAAAVRAALATIPGAPTIVTILPEKLQQFEPEALKTYHFVITPKDMSKWDALEEMDHAMSARLKAAPAPVTSQ